MKAYTRHNVTAGRRQARGYSMVELLIAMGIFAMGFVSLAAVFPAAVQMQKRTIEDVVSSQVVEQVKAVGPEFGADGAASPSGNVELLPNLEAIWPLSSRSYPTSVQVPTDRDYFMVPVQRHRADLSKWQVITFVLKREGTSEYGAAGVPAANVANAGDPVRVPKVVKVGATVPAPPVGGVRNRFNFNNDADGNGVPDQVRMGDQIVDAHGTVYTVSFADAAGCVVNSAIVDDRATSLPPNAIWYGRPPAINRVSPTRGIVTFLADAKPIPCRVVKDNLGNTETDPAGCWPGDIPTFSAGGWSNAAAGYKPNGAASTAAGCVFVTAGSTAVAIWRFNNLPVGNYNAFLTWMAETNNNRASNARVTVRVKTGATGTVLESYPDTAAMNAPPVGPTFRGHPFSPIGQPLTLNVAGRTIEVEVTGEGANGTVIADAVMIEKQAEQ